MKRMEQPLQKAMIPENASAFLCPSLALCRPRAFAFPFTLAQPRPRWHPTALPPSFSTFTLSTPSSPPSRASLHPLSPFTPDPAGAKQLYMRKESYINLPLDALLHACVRRVEKEADKMRFIDFARRCGLAPVPCRRAWRTRRSAPWGVAVRSRFIISPLSRPPLCSRLEELYRCRVASRTKRLRKSFQLFVSGSSDLGYDAEALAGEEDLFLESSVRQWTRRPPCATHMLRCRPAQNSTGPSRGSALPCIGPGFTTR